MATLIGDLARTDYSPSRPRLPSSALAFQNAQAHPSHPSHPSHQTAHQQPSVQPASPAPSASISSAEAAHPPPPAPPAPLAPPSPSPCGASRIPTPPDSASSSCSPTRNGNSAVHMASTASDTAPAAASATPAASAEPTPSAARPPPPTNAIPSPVSDNYRSWTPSGSGAEPGRAPPASVPSPPQDQTASQPRMQRTIHIRDLYHIETLAQLDVATGNGPGILNDPPLQDMKFDISSMPIGDIISMVAALLSKITTTNDHQHDALNRNATQQRQVQAQNDGVDMHTSPFSSSVLAFHGKNVPAITITSYLSRIHKYCPTTYEVFLSLLVYFDRMTERVNDLVIRDEEVRRNRASHRPSHSQSLHSREGTTGRHASVPPSEVDTHMRDPEEASSQGEEMDEGLVDSDDDDSNARTHGSNVSRRATPSLSPALPSATYFVVDSFNIHRLIIAGVTCASKFFSDVFYTNSRYAKVGGLPLAELNHLELQFLILNDFRLAIPLEDLEAYATMLVEFYAREVVGTRARSSSTIP